MSEPMHPDDEAFVLYLNKPANITLEVDGVKYYSVGFPKHWTGKPSETLSELSMLLYEKIERKKQGLSVPD